MDINYLITDWAYRVNNGMPDPKDRNHLELLEDVLRDNKYSDEFIDKYISQIKYGSKIEEFQKFCVEVGKALSEEELITEASISKSQYAVGSKVTLKDSEKVNAVEWWKKAFPKSGTPKELTKVKLQNVPEERIVRIGSGTEEVCLSTGGIIYKIIGTITSIGSKFNHYKDEEAGVSWKDTTLESAALAGLSFNPQPFINSMLSGNEVVAAKAQKGAVAAMKSALSNGEMRAGSAVASGIEKSIPDLIMALELANGMYKFASDKNCIGWKFIHKRIDSYYKAHNKNPKLGDAKPGGKVPTPDCVITNSPDSLITNMENDEVKYTSDGKCTTTSGDVFWQVSNKKSAAGAQLGRITGLVKARYGLPKWSKGVAFMFEEIDIYENKEFLLNEDLKDYFQKGLKYLKDKFQSTISAVSGKLKSIGSSIVSSLNNTSTAPADNLIKKLSKGLTLEEAKQPKLNAWRFSKAVTSEYHKGNQKKYKEVVGHAIKAYNDIKTNPSNGITKTPSSKPPIAGALPKGNPGANTVIKFMVNYLAYNTMKTMMSGQSGKIQAASKILEDFVELEKEMHFGSTNLPIYKVYMSNDGQGAYSYLFSGAEFREKKASIIDEFKSKNIPGLVIESNQLKEKGGYTNNSVYVLSDFKQDGPTYTQVGYRSSGDNKLTFSVQGTTTRTWPWMLKNKKVVV